MQHMPVIHCLNVAVGATFLQFIKPPGPMRPLTTAQLVLTQLEDDG